MGREFSNDHAIIHSVKTIERLKNDKDMAENINNLKNKYYIIQRK